jgi:hypothetical protein
VLVRGGHLGRRVGVEVPLVDEALYQVVEHLRQLRLGPLVPLAAERLQHLGRELAALHEGVEDRLLERVERPVLVPAELPPVGVVGLPPGEARLEEEVGELVEQRLEVDGIGELGAELGIRMESHRRGALPAVHAFRATGPRHPVPGA